MPKPKVTRSKLVQYRFYGNAVLLEEGFESLPRNFVTRCHFCLGLSAVETDVAAALMEWKREDGEDPHPSITLLAVRLAHKESTVRKALNALVARGLLAPTHRPGRTTEWSLRPLMRQLEDFPAAEFRRQTIEQAKDIRALHAERVRKQRAKRSGKPALAVVKGGVA